MLIATSLHAQKVSLVRSALKDIRKGKWAKAEGKLSKAIRKDSLNSFAFHALALYYFTPLNPSRDLERSYSSIIESAKLYSATPNKARERLRKFQFDTLRIHQLRKSIDSATFRLVKQKNSEQGYVDFLAGHPYAEQRPEAIALRDEVAFLDAVHTNSYESFQLYLKKYPASAYAAAAQHRYDKLIYESMTRDGTLEAYERFLKEHPSTPFRRETETKIFELYTLSGETSKFASFIAKYPKSHEVKRSRDILFHLLLERDSPTWPAGAINDSLKSILRLQQRFLIPFLKGSKFGFMDNLGNEVVPANAAEIDDSYVCGNIGEDVLVLPGRLISRNGATVFNGPVADLEDLTNGFLLLQQGNCKFLIHKSGSVIDSCVADAKVVGRRFLSVEKNRKKYLTSFAGRRILAQAWDDITMFGNNVCGLQSGGKWNVILLGDIESYSSRGNQLFAHSYEEVKAFPDGFVWIKDANGQGVLDQQLNDVIPVGQHLIEKSFFGFISHAQNGYSIYSLNGKRSSFFDQVKARSPWVAVAKDGDRYLLDPLTHNFITPPYDSLFLEGPFAIGEKNDSLIVHFPSGARQFFESEAEFKFIPGKDSTAFLLVSTLQKTLSKRGKILKSEEIKELYNIKGKKLFTEKFDEVQVAGKDLFVLSRKEKKALIDIGGKMLLPFDFDAIGNINNNTISLLRSMKFGLYNVANNKLIKPEFDKNVVTYGIDHVIAFRDGMYGIAQWDNLRDLDPQFDEVQYWNDTVALTRKNQRWSLLDIREGKILESGLETIKLISDKDSEKVAIVKRDNSYGVLSSKRGTIIPISFSDLVNVGSPEEPVYFTEKHVPEASIFVVIYYDQTGKMIRREIYENPDDYEKIYCGGQ